MAKSIIPPPKTSDLSDTIRVTRWLGGAFTFGFLAVWIGSADAHAMTALLWALACFVSGALIGFLFGIPRVLQGTPAPPAPAATPATATPTAASTPAPAPSDGYDLRVNTNLEQISDWLTKIIVGIGLVELRTMPARLRKAAQYVAHGMDPSMELFAYGLIVYFSILGFLGAYLITRLYITGAFSRADRDAMNGITKKELVENQIDKIPVPIPGPDKENKPLNAVEAKAVTTVASKSLQDLTAPDDIAVWAKAQLSLGNYADSVKAYGQIINQFSGDLDKRFAYATALYYSGDKEHSLQQLQEAYKQLKPETNPELRRNIYRSLTYQSLFQAPPNSFNDAIRLGEEYVADSKNLVSPGVWANLASAYGQKMSWLLANSPGDQTAQDQTKARALEVVRQTAGMGERWKKKIREMMDKNFPNKDPDENDLEVFANDNAFRQAAGL